MNDLRTTEEKIVSIIFYRGSCVMPVECGDVIVVRRRGNLPFRKRSLPSRRVFAIPTFLGSLSVPSARLLHQVT